MCSTWNLHAHKRVLQFSTLDSSIKPLDFVFRNFWRTQFQSSQTPWRHHLFYNMDMLWWGCVVDMILFHTPHKLNQPIPELRNYNHSGTGFKVRPLHRTRHSFCTVCFHRLMAGCPTVLVHPQLPCTEKGFVLTLNPKAVRHTCWQPRAVLKWLAGG